MDERLNTMPVSTDEYEELKSRLEEAEETLRAIRSGEVDAIVVSGETTDQVFTLRDATHPYRVLVEEMNEGALTLNTNGAILFSNGHFAGMVGAKLESVLGENLSHFIVPRHRLRLKRMLYQARFKGVKGELNLRGADGPIDSSISMHSMRLDGKTRLAAVFSDLKDLRRAEKIIRQQVEQYRSLLATSPDGYMLLDKSGKILDVNESYCRMSGYSRRELLKLTIQKMEAAENPDRIEQHITAVTKNGYERFETRHQKKNGKVIDVEVNVTYLKNTKQLIVFIHDISGRKDRIQQLEEYRLHLEEMVMERTDQVKTEAEKKLQLMGALEESEKRYRELVKSAPTGIYEIDFLTNKLISVNDILCEATGYSREELLNMPAADLLTSESRKLFQERGTNWREGSETTREVEYQIVKKDGTILWAVLNVGITRDANGNPTKATVIAHDITERKQIEDALELSEKRYRELVEFAPTGIYEVDFKTGKFLSVNDAMCDILGYSREELLGMTANEVLDEESRRRFAERVKAWIAGKAPDTNVEYKVQTKEGKEIYAILNVRFTRDVSGMPKGATVIAHDITERKRMEEEIRKTAKELLASNAELKWLNETMVNRELRMVELKKEINELCRKLGVAEKYSS